MKVILHCGDDNQKVLSHVIDERLVSKFNGIEVEIEDLFVEFLNAYDLDFENKKVRLNLERAKQIKIDLIREERNLFFNDFDTRYEIAVRDGADLSDLKKERQLLKDAPQNAYKILIKLDEIEEVIMLNFKDLI